MTRPRPRLFSIPPGEPFLDVLVTRLLDGAILPGLADRTDPLALARATILLPTRRACRALEERFLALAGPALLLPRIRPIGEVDEDDLAFDDLPAGTPDLPDPIRPLDRRVALTRLVLAWAERMRGLGQNVLVPASAADASHLAGELARLMDTVATEAVSWDGIASAVPREMQEHWDVAVRFLKIATEAWPAHLAESGLVDPAERRRLLLEALQARLAKAPAAPVIAAGSTGSIPSTARLLIEIALLPEGAVVLPGLDRDIDEAAFRALARGGFGLPEPTPSHPQAAMASLLHLMEAERADVTHLALGPATSSDARAREALLSEAMRAADTTEAWGALPGKRADLLPGLDGLAIVEARTEQEEALAVACLLREAIEEPGRTAALVTPDRALARRVAAELQRFGLTVDDTSGVPLAETAPGVLARLVAEAARQQASAIPLLALLKHPLASLGRDPETLRRAARALERMVLRGPAPTPGLAGLRAALAAPKRETEAAKHVRDDERLAALDLVETLLAVLGPLEAALSTPRARADLTSLLATHVAALEAITDASTFTRDADGRALRLFLDELLDAGGDALVIGGDDYPELFASLMAGRVARSQRPGDPRLRIYGLLEARLVRHDRVVLGGLAEGVWPATTRTDPWLSRAMRHDMGLPAPEKRIGLSAHDFVQALGTRDAWITRPLRRGGAPTVPSRWLQRLRAVVGDGPYRDMVAKGAPVLALARSLDQHDGPVTPISRPEPRPPVEVRPRKISVTRIETLVRDPYSIYADKILRLRPFEPIGEEIGGAERGTMIHEALAAYTRDVEGRPDAAGLDRLLEHGRTQFAAIATMPELHAFWWPRFERIARWFVAFQAARHATGARIRAEVEGRLVLPLPGGAYELTVKADRLEQHPDGTLKIIDFKTGRAPSNDEVLSGFASQLPIEAAMAAAGAFAADGFAPQLTTDELLYLEMKGGTPAAKETRVKPKDGETLEAFIARQFEELKALLTRYDDPATGYPSLAASRFRLRFGDYDHLARVKEWGVADDREAVET